MERVKQFFKPVIDWLDKCDANLERWWFNTKICFVFLTTLLLAMFDAIRYVVVVYVIPTILVFQLAWLAYLYGCWTTAFVGVKLWNWFVIPAFGFKTVTLTQMFGISMLVRFFTYIHNKEYDINNTDNFIEKPSKKQSITNLSVVISRPWFILFVGYIAHKFFM